MADIYKKIDNKEYKNRTLTEMTSTQSDKVQTIIQNFVNFFKNA